MAKVACRGQVQPGTVQSKAVEKPEKFEAVDSKISGSPKSHFSLAQMTTIWVIQDRANQVPYHGPCQEPMK